MSTVVAAPTVPLWSRTPRYWTAADGSVVLELLEPAWAVHQPAMRNYAGRKILERFHTTLAKESLVLRSRPRLNISRHGDRGMVLMVRAIVLRIDQLDPTPSIIHAG